MSLVFFRDRDLGKQFPDILAAAGLSVERHHDLFRPETPDEEWLEYVGKKGRIAITHDGRIRYKPNELAAIERHRVALLVVVGKAPFPVLARNFVSSMPRIASFLAGRDAPYIAKVYRPPPAEAPASPGTIALWYPRRPT